MARDVLMIRDSFACVLVPVPPDVDMRYQLMWILSTKQTYLARAGSSDGEDTQLFGRRTLR